MPTPAIPPVLPDKGLLIPVEEIRCSFWLIGFIPGNSHNSISSRLVLHPTQFEIKVLNTKHHAYAEIKQVSYKPAWFIMHQQVILNLHDGTDYYILPSYDSTGRELLRFFRQRGVPLSAAAQKALTA